MSSLQPSYLKIHHDDDATEAGGDTHVAATPGVSSKAAKSVAEHDTGQRAVEGFWRTYTETTGWRVDSSHAGGEPMNSEGDQPTPRVMTAEDAQRLADAAREMAGQLQQQQALMRSQQAELAARAAVILDSSKATSGYLSVERVLADATLATSTDAAIVYLLDEETERLSTRFLFGISPEKRLGSSRPLRGARSDLEAMIQGLVVIEDLNAGPIDLYSTPEPFPSGICVCLGDADLPIGTLWLFSRVARSYPDSATAAARIAAANVCQVLTWMGQQEGSANRVHDGGNQPRLTVAAPTVHVAAPLDNVAAPPTQVAASTTQVAAPTDLVDAELDRLLATEFDDADPELGDGAADAHDPDWDAADFVTAMEPLVSRIRETVSPVPPTLTDWTNQIADWQHDTLPLGERLAPGWSIDGMVESPLAIAQSWHHWDVLPDGVIALAICQFGNQWDPRGNMTDLLDGVIARAALQAHACYRHTPYDAVTRVMHSLLQVRDDTIDESGRANVSLFYGHVDPETGRTRMSSIGRWSSLIVSKYGYRPVNLSQAPHAGANRVLGEQAAMNLETTLLKGEVLLVGGADWMGIAADIAAAELPQPHRHESVQNRIGATLKEALNEGERSPLAALRRMTATLPLRCERTAISLLRV